MIKTFIKLSMGIKTTLGLNIKSSVPEDFVPRFCKKLKINNRFIDQAITIAKNAKKLNIANTHTPLSIASASILLTIYMNDLTITKKYLATKFDVSEVTISKAYKSIEKYRNVLINNDKTNHIVTQFEQEKQTSAIPAELLRKRNEIRQKIQQRETNNTILQFQLCNIKYDDVNEYAKHCYKNLDNETQKINEDYKSIIKNHHNNFV